MSPSRFRVVPQTEDIIRNTRRPESWEAGRGSEEGVSRQATRRVRLPGDSHPAGDVARGSPIDRTGWGDGLLGSQHQTKVWFGRRSAFDAIGPRSKGTESAWARSFHNRDEKHPPGRIQELLRPEAPGVVAREPDRCWSVWASRVNRQSFLSPIAQASQAATRREKTSHPGLVCSNRAWQWSIHPAHLRKTVATRFCPSVDREARDRGIAQRSAGEIRHWTHFCRAAAAAIRRHQMESPHQIRRQIPG